LKKKKIEMRKHFLLFFLFSCLYSCTPSKKLFFLEGDSLQRNEIKRFNDTPYKLQVNDQLSIGITSNDQSLVEIFNSQTSQKNSLSNYRIDHFGNIRMPVIGSINILGYTVQEVRKIIENKLEKFIKINSDIFVSVELLGIKYTIVGEINKPGVYIISQNKTSIVDAIANSGNITKKGNLKKVEVIRKSTNGIEKYYIDLSTMNAFNSDVFYIKSNDIININSSKYNFFTNWNDSLLIISSTITLFTSIIILIK